MRVVFIHSSDEGYGSDRVLLTMATHLRSVGDDVLVLLPDDTSDGWLGASLRHSGIAVSKGPLAVARRRYFRGSSIPRYAASLVQARRFVRSSTEGFAADVLHVNTSALIVAALVGRPNGTRKIWHVHEIVRRPRLIAWLLRVLPRASSDLVIAVSHAVKSNLDATRLGRVKQVVVLHNGVPAPPSHRVTDGPVQVLYVGRLSRWKGYQHFVTAAMALAPVHPNVAFVLAGDALPDEEAQVAEARQAIQASGLEGRIQFIGYVTETSALFDRALIVVVPSIEPDPLPTVVLEAMRSGCAVIASRAGGAPEMIEHGVSGLLVPPGDAQVLGEAIAALLHDVDRAKELGEAARQRAHRDFSVLRFCDGYEAVLVRIGARTATSPSGLGGL